MHYPRSIHEIESYIANPGWDHVGFICIVLTREGTDFSDNNIRPHIPYLHLRTGSHLHCFIMGCDDFGYFSNHDFVDAVNDIESHFEDVDRYYKYSGESDLILVKISRDNTVARLDFDNAISINVERFMKIGASSSFPSLIQKILEFSIDERSKDLGGPRGFMISQASSEPIYGLVRSLLSFFNLGESAYDARREWINSFPKRKRKKRPHKGGLNKK